MYQRIHVTDISNVKFAAIRKKEKIKINEAIIWKKPIKSRTKWETGSQGLTIKVQFDALKS